jgi:hypothetical protein
MQRKVPPTALIRLMMMSILLSGCDDRVAQVAEEAAERQAEQNTVMAELNKEVAGGARQLVEADAQARQDIIGVHRDFQNERHRLDTDRNDVESQRRHLAAMRRTSSVLAPAIQTGGLLLLVSVVLGFCWYAVAKSREDGPLTDDISELLLCELLADSSVPISADRQRIGPLGQAQVLQFREDVITESPTTT